MLYVLCCRYRQCKLHNLTKTKGGMQSSDSKVSPVLDILLKTACAFSICVLNANHLL